MKKIIFTLLVTILSFSSNAQETKKNKNAKYSFEVNGNCEMCQKRIQKAALSVSGVKSVAWNVQSHQLDLILNEEKNQVVEVKKAIARAGHDADEVKATDEEYKKLHGCCMYVRK